MTREIDDPQLQTSFWDFCTTGVSGTCKGKFDYVCDLRRIQPLKIYVV